MRSPGEEALIVEGVAKSVNEKIEFFWKKRGWGNLLCLHWFGALPADPIRTAIE